MVLDRLKKKIGLIFFCLLRFVGVVSKKKPPQNKLLHFLIQSFGYFSRAEKFYTRFTRTVISSLKGRIHEKQTFATSSFR